jgi:uncharacterized membrane protein
VFLFGVVIGVVLGAAELVGSGIAWRVVLAGGIPIAYAALVALLGRRSDSLSVLAGRPIDERAVHVSQEASTLAFGITAIVVVVAVAVGIAVRADWGPYAIVAVVMAVAYLGSLAWLQARH